MASNILTGPNNLLVGSGARRGSRLVSVTIGTSKTPLKCRLIDQAGGNQPFRTQYDIALDGSEYVLAAGKGRGTYELKLLEGPFTTCAGARTAAEGQTLSQLYRTQMNQLSGRKIVVITGSTADNSSGNNSRSTQSSWKFSGVIDSLATYAHIQEQGERFIINVISATGMWT